MRTDGWPDSGAVNDGLLDQLLRDDYFAAPPPRAPGRERFDMSLVERIAREAPGADGVATAVELTVRSIVDAFARWVPGTAEVLVSGGGVHHPVLMERLEGGLEGRGCTLRRFPRGVLRRRREGSRGVRAPGLPRDPWPAGQSPRGDRGERASGTGAGDAGVVQLSICNFQLVIDPRLARLPSPVSRLPFLPLHHSFHIVEPDIWPLDVILITRNISPHCETACHKITAALGWNPGRKAGACGPRGVHRSNT